MRNSRDKGAAGVLGLCWSAVIVLLITFLLQLQKVTEAEIKERGRAYLCFKGEVFRQLRFVRRMIWLNRVIVAGRLLILNPKSAPLGKMMVKGAKQGQALLNKYYQWPLARVCQRALISPPFGPSLKRDAWERALLRKKQWKIIVRQKRGFRPFQLEARLKSPRQRPSRLSLKYGEKALFPAGGRFWWNPLFGVPSFF